MKVRVIRPVCGHAEGAIVNTDPKYAQAWIDAGHAAPIDEPKAPEPESTLDPEPDNGPEFSRSDRAMRSRSKRVVRK